MNTELANPDKKSLHIFQVDAFTSEPFSGNPAAVCLLNQDVDTALLQAVAMELNLSETAFLRPLDGKVHADAAVFSLRWFTPTTEVPLCGHATLASAKVLFDEVNVSVDTVTFETLSGKLVARKTESGIVLDFPTAKLVPFEVPAALFPALGISGCEKALYDHHIAGLLIHVADEQLIYDMKPDFEALRTLQFPEKVYELVVTARSSRYDFISRCFCPWIGINEDPVTGATHTLLAPYWSELIGKTEMYAYQASQRGGELTVKPGSSGRTELTGQAVVTVRGEFLMK